MQNFDGAWQNSEAIAMEQLHKEQIMMEQAFQQAQIQDNALMQEMMMKCPHLQDNWNNATEAQMQEQWADQFTHEVNENKLQGMEVDFANAEQIVDKEISEEQAAKQGCNDLMNTMMNDPDPKFRNSRFLHFIQNVNKGNFEIKDNELIKHKEEPIETVEENKKIGIFFK